MALPLVSVLSNVLTSRPPQTHEEMMKRYQECRLQVGVQPAQAEEHSVLCQAYASGSVTRGQIEAAAHQQRLAGITPRDAEGTVSRQSRRFAEISPVAESIAREDAILADYLVIQDMLAARRQAAPVEIAKPVSDVAGQPIIVKINDAGAQAFVRDGAEQVERLSEKAAAKQIELAERIVEQIGQYTAYNSEKLQRHDGMIEFRVNARHQIADYNWIHNEETVPAETREGIRQHAESWSYYKHVQATENAIVLRYVNESARVDLTVFVKPSGLPETSSWNKVQFKPVSVSSAK